MFGKNRAIVLLNQASCFLQKQRYVPPKGGPTMPLVTTTFCNESAQKTTQFLPSEVWVLKFTATNVGCRVEENIGTKGSRMSLEHMYCNNLNIPTLFRVAASEVPYFY